MAAVGERGPAAACGGPLQPDRSGTVGNDGRGGDGSRRCPNALFSYLWAMFALHNLHARLAMMPMLRALIPFAVGIAAADRFLLPAWFVWGGFVVCGSLALVRRSSLYAVGALLLFGWGLYGLHEPRPDSVPRATRCDFELSLDEGRTGRITAWRDEADGRWRAVALRVVVRGDSTLHLRTGERLLVRSYLNDFPAALPEYGALMRRRGYVGTMWIAPWQLLERCPPRGVSLHDGAVERLRRLGLSPEGEALCEAMAAGERSALSAARREAYARSGTSHLLAVSGLHVGIVFLLVNALLGWMPLLRRGHLWRNVVAVALIWLYASVTGLAPSVVRAALMFSALQLSLAAGSVYKSGNILSATAFVMLVWEPQWLFDISFQLSFVAVAAILAWAVPLGRRLRTSWRPLDWLVDMLVVGLVASVATAPLVACNFGQISLAGVAINPLVIPLATLLLFGTVVWMVCPVPWLAPLLGPVLDGLAAAQNGLIDWAARWPWGAVEMHPSAGAVAAVYALFVAITALAGCAEPKKKVSLRR